MNAMDDKSVTVNVNATTSNFTPSGQLIIGGAFMGNTVTKKDGENTVSTNQEVNPGILGKMDDYLEMPGIGILHEVNESYDGGVKAKENGKSMPNAFEDQDNYKAIHDATKPKQTWDIGARLVDAKGKPSDANSYDHIDIYIKVNGKQEQVILQLTKAK
jgi:hypothetical protein